MEFPPLMSSLEKELCSDSVHCQEANEKFMPSLPMLLQLKGKALVMEKYTWVARMCSRRGRLRERSRNQLCLYNPRLAVAGDFFERMWGLLVCPYEFLAAGWEPQTRYGSLEQPASQELLPCPPPQVFSKIILSTPTTVFLYFCDSTLYVIGYLVSVKQETKYKDVTTSATKNIIFVEPLQAVVQLQGNTCTEVILLACIDILF